MTYRVWGVVSKQSSSTNYTNELRANGSEIKIHKLEQKENEPPGPEVCVSHQDGEKVSATENSLAARSPTTKADFYNSQVKSEIQQPVHPKPLSPDARASSLPESSPAKAVKVWWQLLSKPLDIGLLVELIAPSIIMFIKTCFCFPGDENTK